MKYFVRIGGAEIELSVEGDEVHVDDTVTSARLADVEGTPVRLLTIGDEVHRIVVRPALDERMRAIRELAGATAAATGPAPLVAPMPGMIVRVNVGVGDRVHSGQGLVVMEAMKMENELRATAEATVKSVLAQPGAAVEKGALLIELE